MISVPMFRGARALPRLWPMPIEAVVQRVVAFLAAPSNPGQDLDGDAAACGVQAAGRTGHIALVGAGPGARDLLTLRAVERIRSADVIFYDRLVDAEVLDYARRGAERVFVGKEVGACAWPQDRICALIAAEARRGRRVVRLKSGDPSIFGRATEEIEAARQAGVPVEIVPGITAASAAAAAMGRSLTERGETDTLVLTTGTCRPGDEDAAWAGCWRPGTTLAVYMGVRAAGRISAALIADGAPEDTPVDLACDISKDGEAFIRTDLRHMERALAEHGVTGTALILVRCPKGARPGVQAAAGPAVAAIGCV